MAAQLTIALPALGILVVLGERDWSYFTPIIVFLGYLNVVMAVINLLPDDDTDGRIAWRLIPLLIQQRREKPSDGISVHNITEKADNRKRR